MGSMVHATAILLSRTIALWGRNVYVCALLGGGGIGIVVSYLFIDLHSIPCLQLSFRDSSCAYMLSTSPTYSSSVSRCHVLTSAAAELRCKQSLKKM